MITLGSYELRELIGEGGFGRVYKGYHAALKRDVAIKVCTIQQEDFQRRFLREAEIAAGLRHPNIVSVYDFGESEGSPYLVQEFLEGEDLSNFIRRQDHLPIETKVSFLIQIAHGLAFAHYKGVIHRDIKPSNIRVLPDGQIRILDFGIAKLIDDELHLTQTGLSVGTAAYLAPEQLRGERIDHRADIFSFGVLAYELLTYRKPFDGESISAVYYQIAHQDPPPIEPLNPGCPPRLAAVVMRCLRKSPAERFPHCTEIVNDLATVLEPENQQVAPAQQNRNVAVSRIVPSPVMSVDAEPVAVEVRQSRFQLSRTAAIGGASGAAALGALLWIGFGTHGSRTRVPPLPVPVVVPLEHVQTSDSTPNVSAAQANSAKTDSQPAVVDSTTRASRPTPGSHAPASTVAGRNSHNSTTAIGNRTLIALFILGDSAGGAGPHSELATAVEAGITESLSQSGLRVVANASKGRDAALRPISSASDVIAQGRGVGAGLAISGTVSVVPQGEMLGMKSALCTLDLKVYDVRSGQLVAEALERAPGPGGSIELANDRAVHDCVNKAIASVVRQLSEGR